MIADMWSEPMTHKTRRLIVASDRLRRRDVNWNENRMRSMLLRLGLIHLWRDYLAEPRDRRRKILLVVEWAGVK